MMSLYELQMLWSRVNLLRELQLSNKMSKETNSLLLLRERLKLPLQMMEMRSIWETLNEGDYFGEIAMLTKAPRTCNCYCKISEKVQCISLEAELLQDFWDQLKKFQEEHGKLPEIWEYIQ